MEKRTAEEAAFQKRRKRPILRRKKKVSLQSVRKMEQRPQQRLRLWGDRCGSASWRQRRREWRQTEKSTTAAAEVDFSSQQPHRRPEVFRSSSSRCSMISLSDLAQSSFLASLVLVFLTFGYAQAVAECMCEYIYILQLAGRKRERERERDG